MAWWQAAAIAAPVLAGMFTNRPDVPGYQGRQQYMTPEELAYYNEFLQSAFSPQSELARLAQEQANSQIMGSLARSGLTGSSLALQAQRAQAADLANKFLERELERRQMGLNAMNNRAKMELGIGEGIRDAALQRYQADLGGKQALIGGLGSLGGIAASLYGNQQIADQMQANRDFMTQQMLMRPGPAYQAPAAYYGVPGMPVA